MSKIEEAITLASVYLFNPPLPCSTKEAWCAVSETRLDITKTLQYLEALQIYFIDSLANELDRKLGT